MSSICAFNSAPPRPPPPRRSIAIASVFTPIFEHQFSSSAFRLFAAPNGVEHSKTPMSSSAQRQTRCGGRRAAPRHRRVYSRRSSCFFSPLASSRHAHKFASSSQTLKIAHFVYISINRSSLVSRLHTPMRTVADEKLERERESPTIRWRGSSSAPQTGRPVGLQTCCCRSFGRARARERERQRALLVCFPFLRRQQVSRRWAKAEGERRRTKKSCCRFLSPRSRLFARSFDACA